MTVTFFIGWACGWIACAVVTYCCQRASWQAAIDAAMMLVPAGCAEGGMTWEPEGCRVELQMPTQVCSGTGATPSLALTAAALCALAAMEE